MDNTGWKNYAAKIKTRVLEEDLEENTSALGVFQLTESPAGFPTPPTPNSILANK